MGEEQTEKEKEEVEGVIIKRTRFLLLLLVFQFIYAIFFSKIRFATLNVSISLTSGGLCEIYTLNRVYRTVLFLSTDSVNKLYFIAKMFYGEGNLSILFVSVILSSLIVFYFGFIFASIGCVGKDIFYLEIGLVILLTSDFLLNIISFIVSFANLTFMGFIYTSNLIVLALFSFFLTK